MQSLSRTLQTMSSSVRKMGLASLRSSTFQVWGQRFATAVAPSAHSSAKCEPKPDHSWEGNPDCDKNECGDAKRLDDVCPHEDPCNTGPFNQTWNECPPRVIEEVPFCTGDKMPVATPRKGRPKPSPKQSGLSDKNDRCPKMRYANCREVSKAMKCGRTRMPSDCVRIPAPCLSFSECEKDLPPWKHPSECNCFTKQCEPTDD